MNYVGKPLAYILATPGAARRSRQSAARRVRQRGQRPRHRRVRAPLRLHGLGRLRVHRERRHHHPRGRLPARVDRQGLPGRGDLRPARRCTECEVARFDEHGALVNARRGGRGAGQHPAAAGCSAATTTTRTPPTSGCGTACTGPATWPTATPTAGSTSPAAPPTGCGSTARTSTAAPIERILIRLPAISRVAVYPVPDEHVGDQVMAALVLRERRDADARGLRRVPRRPAGPVAEGVAALRLDRRRRCPAPRPTRCSSANWSRWAPNPRAGGSGAATVAPTARSVRRNRPPPGGRLGCWRLTWHNGPPTPRFRFTPQHPDTGRRPGAHDRRGNHEIGYSP